MSFTLWIIFWVIAGYVVIAIAYYVLFTISEDDPDERQFIFLVSVLWLVVLLDFLWYELGELWLELKARVLGRLVDPLLRIKIRKRR